MRLGATDFSEIREDAEIEVRMRGHPEGVGLNNRYRPLILLTDPQRFTYSRRIQPSKDLFNLMSLSIQIWIGNTFVQHFAS